MGQGVKLSQTIPVSWGLDSPNKVNKTHWPLDNKLFLCNSVSQAIG